MTGAIFIIIGCLLWTYYTFIFEVPCLYFGDVIVWVDETALAERNLWRIVAIIISATGFIIDRMNKK